MKKVNDYFKALHQIPELSLQEFKTSAYIFSALEEMGYEPKRSGDTGVYADLICDANLPWILLRADIDALAITEETNLPYSSGHPGCMHACGHDGHTAMLLAAAGQLKNRKLPQNIRFVFQPAEENVEGAAVLIKKNILDISPKAAFAMHLWPQIPLGTLATRSGALMASGDIYHIYCHGKSVHCSQREKGNDALQAALQIYNSLPEIESLGKDADSMIFCGNLEGGTTHNIVPNQASLWGTIRTYSSQRRLELKQTLADTVARIGSLLGVETELQWEGCCPVTENDASLVSTLSQLFPALDTEIAPTRAAEDFAYYQEQCPGVMLWLGIGDTSPLHSKDFVVPQEVLSVGVDSWIKIAQQNWSF